MFFLSRISGLAPSSLPVIFSRMVVFPAFHRPMISTRNRLHNRLRSLYETDEWAMLVRSTNRRDDTGTWFSKLSLRRFVRTWLKPYHPGQILPKALLLYDFSLAAVASRARACSSPSITLSCFTEVAFWYFYCQCMHIHKKAICI
jgi:hypothetical protein